VIGSQQLPPCPALFPKEEEKKELKPGLPPCPELFPKEKTFPFSLLMSPREEEKKELEPGLPPFPELFPKEEPLVPEIIEPKKETIPQRDLLPLGSKLKGLQSMIEKLFPSEKPLETEPMGGGLLREVAPPDVQERMAEATREPYKLGLEKALQSIISEIGRTSPEVAFGKLEARKEIPASAQVNRSMVEALEDIKPKPIAEAVPPEVPTMRALKPEEKKWEDNYRLIYNALTQPERKPGEILQGAPWSKDPKVNYYSEKIAEHAPMWLTAFAGYPSIIAAFELLGQSRNVLYSLATKSKYDPLARHTLSEFIVNPDTPNWLKVAMFTGEGAADMIIAAVAAHKISAKVLKKNIETVTDILKKGGAFRELTEKSGRSSPEAWEKWFRIKAKAIGKPGTLESEVRNFIKLKKFKPTKPTEPVMAKPALPGAVAIPDTVPEAPVVPAPKIAPALETVKTVIPEKPSHVGEGGWSPEAISRAKETKFFLYDTKTKKSTPVVGVDAVDVSPSPVQMKFQKNLKTGEITLLDKGEKVSVTPQQTKIIKETLGGKIPLEPPIKPPPIEKPIEKPAEPPVKPVGKGLKVTKGVVAPPSKDVSFGKVIDEKLKMGKKLTAQEMKEVYFGKRPAVKEPAEKPLTKKAMPGELALELKKKLGKEELTGKPAVDLFGEATKEKLAEGDFLSKATGKMVEEVRKAQKEKYPKPGLAIEKIIAPSKRRAFSFSDKKIEERYKASEGIKKPPMTSVVTETLTYLKNKMTRTYEYLPNTAKWIEAKTALKHLEKQRMVSKDRALRLLQGITIENDKVKHNLFKRKVMLDDLAEELKLKHDLPFGFKKESLVSEKARLDTEVGRYPEISKALANRGKIWDALKEEYIYWQEQTGSHVEDAMKKKNYFRHQVLEYARVKGILSEGKRLKVPKGRGFLKERKGSELDINTDYFQAESEVMSQMLYDIEIAKALKRIEPYSIHKKVKALAKEQGLDDWHKAIPDDYVAWQPREGNVFYMADTIPERIAAGIMEDAITDIAVVKKYIRESLAIGQKRTEWVIKEGLAKTLSNLTQRDKASWLGKISKKLLKGWKVWTLISPRRFFKYNIRNLTGDADAAFVGNPSGFKKVPRAINDLYKLFVGNEPMSKEGTQWFNRGGMETTLQAQEISELGMFKNLYERKGGLTKTPEKLWKKYWRTARLSTDFREATLRYANYLDYLEQIQKSPTGTPKNFGASLKKEITAMKDPRDKAFRLSNELLGAYDEISVLGQTIREHIYPFWSWKELNFRRYVRLFKNAAQDNRLAGTIGKTFFKGVAHTPIMALRLGKFAIMGTAFWTMCQIWNHLMFPEEEKSLPEHIKGRTHVILGKDKDGKVQYFSRLGALGDFLEWFGLDAAPNLVSSFLSGRKSMRDIAKEMAQAPTNQVVQGLSPFIKTPMEMATRRALFPDVFNPKTIRDRGLALARNFALENEYRAIMGKPGEPYKETLPKFFLYKSDPMASAYYTIYDMKNDFLKKAGRGREGFWLTPKGNALYNVKTAHRYGDTKGEIKYLNEYIAYHLLEKDLLGKPDKAVKDSIIKGLNASIGSMHPLSGMNKHYREAFEKSLSEMDKEVLAKAIRYYNETLIGTMDIDIDKLFEEQLNE
jgi:hypothetical protein